MTPYFYNGINGNGLIIKSVSRVLRGCNKGSPPENNKTGIPKSAKLSIIANSSFSVSSVNGNDEFE